MFLDCFLNFWAEARCQGQLEPRVASHAYIHKFLLESFAVFVLGPDLDFSGPVGYLVVVVLVGQFDSVRHIESHGDHGLPLLMVVEMKA